MNEKKAHIPYQRHQNEVASVSDSVRKLERLNLPTDLTGKRVLDIGCNEGFFCWEAASRGAAEAIGIDANLEAIEEARRRYAHPAIRFLHRNWKDLPEGPFDLVLWTSAMHYERDPAWVLANISRLLAPDGVLILECGIFEPAGREMVLVQRRNESLWYPSQYYLLNSLLAPFAVRQSAGPEKTPGDPVPRTVFHCRIRLPMVLLVRGNSGEGKSVLARALTAGASKVISLDTFVRRIAESEFHHTDLQQLIRNLTAPDLHLIYLAIDQHGLTEQYAALLAESVMISDRLVLFEGFMTDPQAAALSRHLHGKAFLWEVAPPDYTATPAVDQCRSELSSSRESSSNHRPGACKAAPGIRAAACNEERGIDQDSKRTKRFECLENALRQHPGSVEVSFFAS